MTSCPPFAAHAGSRRLIAIAIVAVVLPLCAPRGSSSQVTFEVLKGFEAPFLHGDAPDAGLIQAANGSFYGTTLSGGA